MVRPARVKDVGKYQVSLSNALGTAESAADVRVKKTYQAPHFAQKITDLQQVGRRCLKKKQCSFIQQQSSERYSLLSL